MGISESFIAKYFSAYDYMDRQSRIAAEKVADIIPGTFRSRDREAYQEDVQAIEVGGETHSLKADSVVNQIK